MASRFPVQPTSPKELQRILSWRENLVRLSNEPVRSSLLVGSAGQLVIRSDPGTEKKLEIPVSRFFQREGKRVTFPLPLFRRAPNFLS